MSAIVCILPNKSEKDVDVLSEADAVHYHKMQQRGYSFKKKVVVHKPIDSSKICTGACEG